MHNFQPDKNMFCTFIKQTDMILLGSKLQFFPFTLKYNHSASYLHNKSLQNLKSNIVNDKCSSVPPTMIFRSHFVRSSKKLHRKCNYRQTPGIQVHCFLNSGEHPKSFQPFSQHKLYKYINGAPAQTENFFFPSHSGWLK
jgi:hypothetical protein